MCNEEAARGRLTEMLRRASVGDHAAANAALDEVYPRLVAHGDRMMAAQSSSHTLTTGDLVHLAFHKVTRSTPVAWESRGHYLAVMCRAMRQVLVDHARQRNREKRGGGRARVPLTGIARPKTSDQVDVLTVHDALERLASIDELAARVVELKAFLLCTTPEIAEALEVSKRTVERNWTFARTWLHGELSE